MKYPKALCQLITVLKKLPGIGEKTAERYAFELLDWPEDSLHLFAQTVDTLKQSLCFCKICGSLMEDETCCYCTDPLRDRKKLCIVSSSKDIFSIENTGTYKGLYHVIEKLLSPIRGWHEEDIDIEKLKSRIEQHDVGEIIIALDSTLEGDTTALYLKKQLPQHTTKMTRLAFGLPMGSNLDFIDMGTLQRALDGRQIF